MRASWRRRSGTTSLSPAPGGCYTAPEMPTEHQVTQLLQAWSDGQTDALDELIPLVFEDLRRMARYFFQRESETHILQPTALVSEVYVRLRGQTNTHWDNRAQFSRDSQGSFSSLPGQNAWESKIASQTRAATGAE